MENRKKLLATAVLVIACTAAQAGGIDALKRFNDDADGISGTFTQTVRSKNKTQSKTDQHQAIGDSPAAMLSNKTALDDSYSLKEDGSKNGIDYVLATPKKNNAGYRFIRIGFKGGELAAMELKDSFGNQTAISFGSLNTKPNLSPSAFTFTPPKGVDVLEQ